MLFKNCTLVPKHIRDKYLIYIRLVLYVWLVQ